ncbi:MAG: MFS transporter [Patescibacteria group bacterium]
MSVLGVRHYNLGLVFKKVPRPIKMMALVMFFFSFGWGFIDPWWAIYIEKITNSFWLTGVVLALFGFTGLLVSFPLGQAIDRFDHKQIIRCSLVLYLIVAALYFAAGYLNSVPLLIVAVLINGISSIMIYETSQAYVDHNYKGDKSYNYSFYLSLDALGFILGTFLVLAVVTWWPLYYGYLVVFLFILLNLLVERRLPPTTKTQSSYWKLTKELFSSKLLGKAIKALPHYSSFFYLQIVIIFTLWFVNFGFLLFIPLFGLEQNLSLIQIGLVAIFFQLPQFLAVYYATTLKKLAKKYVIAIFFGLMTGLLLLFFTIHTQTIFYLVSFLLSSAIVILDITVRPVIFYLSPDHLEGEAASITKVAEKTATVLAPIIVGLLASLASFKVSYLLFAVMAFIVGWVAFHFYHGYQPKIHAPHQLTKLSKRLAS